ncbi:hypothetical protein [Azospirillum endophyticum]
MTSRWLAERCGAAIRGFAYRGGGRQIVIKLRQSGTGRALAATRKRVEHGCSPAENSGFPALLFGRFIPDRLPGRQALLWVQHGNGILEQSVERTEFQGGEWGRWRGARG